MTSVFIICPVRLYRERLAQGLEHEKSIDVLGTASTTNQAIPRIVELVPEVVLLNSSPLAGATAIRSITQRVPTVKVIALAVPEAEADLVGWVEIGASAFLGREASAEDLIQTVESVVRDEMPCPPRAAAALARRVATLAAATVEGRHGDLTARETQILELISEGLSNKEIAKQLTIEVPTVKTHVHSIFEKLQVHRRIQAAAWFRSVT
jgi:two-component system, NarL family, nitrate/nitrite response regulator NarL